MLDSIALYGSSLLTIAGLVRLRRKGGAAMTLAGLAGVAAALFWPAGDKHATGTTQLDRVMPAWEFDERHEIEIAATPERIFDAIRRVRASDIRFFNTLTAIRRGGRKQRENILNAGNGAPILDVALRSGFFVMADDSPRELVIGSYVIRPQRAVAAMNFLVIPHGSTATLVTETRVHATDDWARRRFAVYWRIIHPGSDIIRREWLAAIARRCAITPEIR